MRILSRFVLGLLLVLSLSDCVFSQEAAVAPAETETTETGDDSINTCDATKEEEESEPSEDSNANATSTEEKVEVPKQSGPFIDLFGENLLSLKMVDESHAQIETHLTNDALKGKKVVGVYFSADWCGVSFVCFLSIIYHQCQLLIHTFPKALQVSLLCLISNNFFL